ncbi:hypothetical protein KBA73_01955 [Patescibacteria group bacterium]|nr:hypothetical protein [Patescibacteria group bacterium]
MRWNAWWLSCKLAWGQRSFRILSVLIVAVMVIAILFFSEQVIAMGRHHETLAVHYNVYVGIDNVQRWQWSLLLPLGWCLFTLSDIGLAYVTYRRDREAAVSLLVFAGLGGLPWMAFLFYLTVLNR